MKTIRTLLACAMCMAAILSCDSYDGVTIVNHSSQTVSFVYGGAPHILMPGQSEICDVAWYTPAPVQIRKTGGGTVKVELIGHYEFIDAARIELFVVNYYSREVELEADDCIDGDGTETKTTIILGSGVNTSASSPSVFIYTKKPNFRVKLPGTTQYINVPVKYHYSQGGTLESGTVVPSAMSVVIGP